MKMVQSTVAAGGALDPWSSRTTAQRIARGTAYGPSAPPPYWAEIHALEEAKAKAAIAVAAAQIKQKLITGRALTEKERQVASIAGLSVADVVQARKRILKEQLQEKVARGVVLSRAERFSADELKVQYDPKLDEKGRPVKFQPFLSDARKAALKAVLENKVARDVPLTPREEWYAYYLGVLKGDPPPEIALMNPPDFAAQGGAPARRRRAKKRAR
ncbi:MAG TPA: hypothetical protein VN032_09215 [Thermoanaerobaculia bacterium]|nr:hypothetical protein [Thermoanaerobaculia bacterium]